MKKPTVEGKPVKYAPDEPGQFDELPEWLRKKIAAVPAQRAAPVPDPDPTNRSETEFDDDIPF
jgi:hypothetical protein